jgi:predicted membrane GTPase involved in stress response
MYPRARPKNVRHILIFTYANDRLTPKDEKVYLAPPKKMTVEELIGYMSPDEMIEVTPKGVRLRKAQLDPTLRRKDSRVKKQQQDALNRK